MHWIRARCQKHRWHEEFILTTYEMEWTVRYFMFQASLWTDRRISAQDSGLAGAAAYAARKIGLWITLAHNAEAKFLSINSNHYRFVNDGLKALGRVSSG